MVEKEKRKYKLFTDKSAALDLYRNKYFWD